MPTKSADAVDRLGRYLVLGHRMDQKTSVLRWPRHSEGSADFVTWTHMCANGYLTEHLSGTGLKLFGFIAELVFAFIPESCS